jgi:mono/diheme cytochrome c family protein
MHRNIWIATASLMAMGGAACSDGAPDKPEVTYWQDVAPIFFENCVSCHQPDGIAPFRLDTYEEAKEWSAAARQAVEERTMPPWLVTSDGSCGEFRDSRWLADEEIEAITAWAEAGAPEGTPRDDLQVPAASEPGTGLDDGSGEIMAVTTPDYVPEPDGSAYAKYDDYRCFLIDGAIDRDRFITGYEVVPGNDALVHHVILMVVNPDLEVAEGKTNMDAMRAMDEASPDRLGWPCYSLAGDGVAVDSAPVTWAPGMGPVPYPDRTGVRLPAGRVLVVQVHYNLVDESVRGQSDSTLARLRVADEVEREGLFALPDLLLDSDDTLPPGMESVPYTWELGLDDALAAFGVDHLDIYGVFPHMHELGRRYRMEIVDEGGEAQCAAEVENWDFDWQLFYFYEEPIQITPGKRLRVTCEYDTRGRTEPTTPGWGTQNEMCVGGVFLVFP